MKSLKKLFTAFIAGFAAVTISTGCALAADVKADYDYIPERGHIDWTNGMIIAEGTAAGKETAPNPVIKQTQAKTAARVVASRNLLEIVEGVNITSGITVKNAVLKGDLIQSSVEGLVKGAKELDCKFDEYGNCTITMALPLFGNNSLARTVMPKTTKKPFPKMRPVKPATPTNKVTITKTVTTTTTTTTTITGDVKAAEPNNRPSHPTRNDTTTYARPTYAEPSYEEQTYSDEYYEETPYDGGYENETEYAPYEEETPEVVPYEEPVAQQPTAPAEYYDVSQEKPVGNFSSLVVDCRGLEKELRPVMSAVVRNTEGDGIYGVSNLDYDLVVEKGMCSYTKDPTLANVSRVGDNPLVVTAVKLDEFGSTPFITVEDANRVLLENQATKFLDNMNVVFIR